MKLGFEIKKARRPGLAAAGSNGSGHGSATSASSIRNAFSAAAPAKEKEVKVFITEFDAKAVAPATEAEQRKKSMVIPLIKQNEWAASDEAGAAVAVKAAADTDSAKPLTADEVAAQALLADARGGKDGGDATGKASTMVIPMQDKLDGFANGAEDPKRAELFVAKAPTAAENAVPILRQNVVPGMDSLKDVTEKYRHDFSLRPDELDVHSDAYANVPVEEFGAALLRGMGWKGSVEDEEDKEANEIKPRHKLLGLGATMRPALPGESRRGGKSRTEAPRSVGLNKREEGRDRGREKPPRSKEISENGQDRRREQSRDRGSNDRDRRDRRDRDSGRSTRDRSRSRDRDRDQNRHRSRDTSRDDRQQRDRDRDCRDRRRDDSRGRERREERSRRRSRSASPRSSDRRRR